MTLLILLEMENNCKVNISIKVVNDLAIKSPDGRGEIRGYCPVCFCNDADFNIDKGVWYCWQGKHSGRITDGGSYSISEEFSKSKESKLDVVKIRELYYNLTQKYHDKITEDVVEYLNSRGIKNDTISKFKLGFCPTSYFEEYSSDIAEPAGIINKDHPTLANRVIIPYIVNGEVTDLRGRILDTVYHYKKGTPIYKSLSGSYNSRGANYFFNHDIINKYNVLLLTEGEFKALIAAQYGFPIIATPGITKWTDEWTKLLKSKKIILVADNEDVAGQCRYSPCFIQAKTLMLKLPYLKVAILPRGKNEKKVDVDSFILKYGVSAFEKVLRGAIDVDDYVTLEEGKNRWKKKKK